MFGKMVERYCSNCKENIKYNVSVGYTVKGKSGKNYYNNIFCPKCGNDLAEEDRKIIKKAKEDGEISGVAMY